jgi:hypothetical protein
VLRLSDSANVAAIAAWAALYVRNRTFRFEIQKKKKKKHPCVSHLADLSLSTYGVSSEGSALAITFRSTKGLPRGAGA